PNLRDGGPEPSRRPRPPHPPAADRQRRTAPRSRTPPLRLASKPPLQMYRPPETLHLYDVSVPFPITSGPPRRRLIADAGVRIIAAHGLRALTHRAVDRA